MPPCSVCLLFPTCIATRARLSLGKSSFVKSKPFPHKSFGKNPTKPNNNKKAPTTYIISTIFLTVKGHSLLCILPVFLLSIVFSFPTQKVELTSFRELFHSLINFSVNVFPPPFYKAHIFLILFFLAYYLS